MSSDGSRFLVSLRRLLPEARFVGCQDVTVSGASGDSRTIEPGHVFVAIRGPQIDGHQFADEALRRGARGLVVQQVLPHVALPQCVVPDTRVAFALLCHALEGNPAAKLKVIGITGTNGKSTTAFLVKSVLEAAGNKSGLIGTIEHFDGVASRPSTLTTPAADVLAKLMRRMVDAGCSHLVMEVSSHALDQRRVAGIQFDVAVFTNLTQDHLDYHADFAAYRQAKGRLFRGLAPNAWAVLNADDPASIAYASDCQGRVLTYAVRNAADFRAEMMRLSLAGNRIAIRRPAGTALISTQLIGEHNVYNCLAAMAVGHCLGIDRGAIQSGLVGVQGVPGRLEPVRCGQPFHVFVDYAHTPQALVSTLKCLRAITAGRLLCLMGAGGDRDRSKRPLMAQAAEADADSVVVTSDNPRTEDPLRIIAEIVTGFRRTDIVAIEPDRRMAIERVISMAQAGDSVLLAGKGHETYQIVGTDRVPFDDRQVAAECLARLFGTDATRAGAGTEERHPALPRRYIACGA